MADDRQTLPSADGNGQSRDVIDPLIRAHVYSLCTALGGSSVEGEQGVYVLGDDALACLRDIRRWLKLYDEKLNRLDVARCLSEMNLVKGDLLEILAQWQETDTAMKSKHRIALASVELLAPLTWPFEKNNEQMTINHHRHIPVLQHAQLGYKAAFLHHRSKKILKDIIRVALPSMAMPTMERSDRDDAIIKLSLYVLRNIAVIEHPNPGEMETGEEIGRSATIEAFSEQNVLDFILTVASGIGEDFRMQDGVLMEIIYHIIKAIDVETVFMSDKENAKKKGKDLTLLLRMEDDMKRAKTEPTRHNRFGTTLWLERNDGTRSFVSGQSALLGKATGLEKLDNIKKWKKPGGADSKGVSHKTEFDIKVQLNEKARHILRKFIEDFIDSGFNPLFYSIRRAIDSDVDRLLNTNTKQYFYAVAWFLEAERVRRKAAAKELKQGNASVGPSDDSFSVVAAVLNQEFLITLNRKMVDWFELKQWNELQAGMRCFTQILYTIQDMGLSLSDDDQEISENIQNRLFYEETTLNLIYDICRSFTKQPFRWLDDCTEMVHVHLKLLEKYSEQHEHMFIRSRKRQSKKDNEQSTVPEEECSQNEENDEELAAARRRAVAERSFDFRRFETKYLNQNCINTFITFLSYYKELDSNQIMRAVKYFHRIIEKLKMDILLFRLDFVDLIYQMVQGSQPLPKNHPAFKHVEQFGKHFLRKLLKKLESEPAMYVELLFTKMNNFIHFLQHGYDEEKRIYVPRAAAELHVKPGAKLSHGEQIGVGIGALLDGNKSDAVEWLKDVFTKAVHERNLWEAEAQARNLVEAESKDPDNPDIAMPEGAEIAKPPDIVVIPDSEERKTAMFKDSVLRMLLNMVGCERIDVNETPDTKWIIPGTLSLNTLSENLTYLQQYANDPPSYNDGTTAESLIARKAKPRTRRTELSSDEDDGDIDEMLFEPGGPTAMKSLHKKNIKGTRSKRLHLEAEKALDPLLEERRRKREEREKQKQAQIKSTLFVHDSDDEENEEADKIFFERERQIRARGPRALDDQTQLMGKGRKVEISDIEDEGGDQSGREPSPKKRKKEKQNDSNEQVKKPTKEKSKNKNKKQTIFDSTEESSDGGNDNANDSSSDGLENIAPLEHSKEMDFDISLTQGDDEDDYDDVQVARPTQRKRATVIDSDEE